MCGIAGWFSPLPIDSGDALPRLQNMIAAIAHRGPDGRGYVCTAHAALGHARLAIIDLEGGRQPLKDPTRDVTIVFNGEIYNYPQLRRELQGQVHVFATHSDTEVILKLYLQEGAGGFDQLRGMYAFALWDGERRRAILARDPQGIKPLFYRLDHGGLGFASEAKALLAGGHAAAELDESSLHLLMNFRYLPGERTLFRGIEQLAPGEILQWDLAGRTQRFTIAPPSSAPGADVLAALEDSVAVHLTADVEVAAYLSGGMDSAAVAALAARKNPALRTFTLRVGDDPREADHAAQTAALLGVRNQVLECHADMNSLLPRLIWHLETPKVNAVQVALLARHTVRHVKVALSGLGGDELFLGYNLFRWLAQAHDLGRILPGFLGRLLGGAGGEIVRRLQRAPWSEAERAMRIVGELPDWPRVYGLMRNVWDSPALRRLIYGPRLLDSALPDAFDVIRARWPAGMDPVMAAARYERREKMVNDLLWNEDRCSMAAGLEVRVPFVDTVLASAVARLDRRVLMNGGRPKAWLRRELQKLLPAQVMRRPKSGFQIDAPRFYHEFLRMPAHDILSEAALRRHGLFNPRFVRRLMALPPAPRHRWHYFMLFLMLGMHLWMEQFVLPGPAAGGRLTVARGS